MAGTDTGSKGPFRWFDKPATHPRPMQDLPPAVLVEMIDAAADLDDALGAQLEITARVVSLPPEGGQSGLNWWANQKERPFEGMPPEQLVDMAVESGMRPDGDLRDYLEAKTEMERRAMEAEQRAQGGDAAWVPTGRVDPPGPSGDPAQQASRSPDRRAFGPPPEEGGPKGAEIGQGPGKPGV
jgi:hypothetical protein